jgi:hypothetical protein
MTPLEVPQTNNEQVVSRDVQDEAFRMSGLIENPTSVDWSGMRWTPNGFRLLVPALRENPKPATTLSSEHEVANSISLLSFDASPYEPFLVEWTDQLGDIRIQRLSRDPFGDAGIILFQTDASGRIKWSIGVRRIAAFDLVLLSGTH